MVLETVNVKDIHTVWRFTICQLAKCIFKPALQVWNERAIVADDCEAFCSFAEREGCLSAVKISIYEIGAVSY